MMIRAARLERETDDHGDDYEDGDGDDDGVALEQKTADKEFKFPNGRLALENNRKEITIKHRKNCEFCPVSQLIVR